jgi:HPt (histidine-containing phosphotransfer) domain-containing protein
MPFFDQMNDELRPVLPEYFENLSADLDDLRSAEKRGDREEVHRIARGIKGSAGSFGLPELQRHARTLEEAAAEETGDWREPHQDLIELARDKRESLNRPGDRGTLFGGEEFVVILPETDEEGAFQVTRQIWANFASLIIPHETSDVVDVLTLSAGVGALRPDERDCEFNRSNGRTGPLPGERLRTKLR